MMRSASRRGSDADRQVDEEDPAPRERLGEHAAEQQARGAASRRDRAPDSERLRTLGAVRERARDDRERSRRDERGAETLEGPAADEHAGRGRDAVHERRDR